MILLINFTLKLGRPVRMGLNRRGAVGRMTFYAAFFAALAMIAAGIATGILIFYGTGYDFRQADSDVLNYQIGRCISEKDIDWSVRENFFVECNINKKVIEDKEYVIGILSSRELFRHRDYKICEFEAEKAGSFPRCSRTEFFVKGEKFRVITGSNQRIRRALG